MVDNTHQRQPPRNTFSFWLFRQTDREDKIGNLARWAVQNPNWPVCATDREDFVIAITGDDLKKVLTKEERDLYLGLLASETERSGKSKIKKK